VQQQPHDVHALTVTGPPELHCSQPGRHGI
jgi:hypothetical protein